MKNLHNLDLLRSFAVTLVLIDHTSYSLGHPFLWAWNVGYLGVFGVYLFFVHTCLVLMPSLERRPSALNFYIRRAFRIYPLAITAVIVALAFHIPVYEGGSGWVPMHFDHHTIFANLLLLQDVANKQNIVGVMWTLTIEVQMYVMLPALFFLARFENKVWPIALLWALAVIELNQYLPINGNILPTVVPDFLPGVMAYLIFKKLQEKKQNGYLPAWLFLPFVFILLAWFMHRPGTARSWPVMLVFGLLLPVFKQISLPWFVILSQKVAMYSYGIYIWHSFGMKLAFHFLENQAGWVKVVGELLFTAVASVATYHWIEQPMIDLGKRFADRIDHKEKVAPPVLIPDSMAT